MEELYDRLPRLPRDHPLSTTAASVSPLLLAMYRQPQIKPYPHMRYLDRHLLALTNLELYPDGPGPPPDVYGRKHEGEGAFTLLGTGFQAATSQETHEHAEVLLLRPGTLPNPDDPDHDYGPNRVVTRLAIALPPRHGKSTLVTEHLPIWFLLRHPESSIVVSTYNQDFADTWGKGQRALLTENEVSHYSRLPLASDGLPLKPQEGTTSDISFRPGKDIGEIHYRGFRGSLTGIGWNLGIIDDPFKDHEDAHSDATRRQKHDWYSSVFRSRVTRRPFAPPPLEIMMFTRWHEDDIAGKFAYQEDGETPAPGWFVLRLPALSEGAQDPLARPEGASLCPQLMSRDHLLAEQKQDPAVFACLFQGSPSSTEGSLFHTPFKHYTRTSEGFALGTQVIPYSKPLYYTTVDLAASLKTQADYTVFSHWAFDQTTQTLLLVDALRERISTEKHAEALHRFLARQRPDEKADFVGIEDKSFGTNLINEIRVSPDFHDYPIIPLKADKDKYTRAVPYAEACNAGKVWFPDPRDWPLSQTWENEHARFPKRAKHDDMVDTGAYAYQKTRDYQFAPSTQKPYKRPDDSERAWQQLEARSKKNKRGGFQRALNGQL